mgnify:CR=1 FL=1
MRVKIKFKGENGNVPFNTQAAVNSYIHDCLGRNNEFHDRPSNYSLTSLQGGRVNDAKTGLSFKDDAFLIVSSQDADFIGKLLMGVMSHREFSYGMSLLDVEQVSEEMHEGWNHLTTITPILLKRGYKQKGPDDYVKVTDADFAQRLKEHLVRKLSKIDPTLDLSGVEVSVPDRPFNKVRRVMIKNIPNYASNCWVSIRCSKKVATMIYHLGLGQSTGSGFGTVCLNQNRGMYYPGGAVRNEKPKEVEEVLV